MIPKQIHYIWLGGRPIPAASQVFIDQWKKIMPDWVITRWDETNIEFDNAPYFRQTWELKHWAFASDYLRVKILHENGGIYLDIDEEVIRSLNPFTSHQAFFGMEPGNRLQAGVFGCEKENPVIGAILDYYRKIDYLKDDIPDHTVSGGHFSRVLESLYPDTKLTENSIQMIDTNIAIYPSHYFCPDLLNLKITDETYTIHHPMGSWLSPLAQLRKKTYIFITKCKPLAWVYGKFKR